MGILKLHQYGLQRPSQGHQAGLWLEPGLCPLTGHPCETEERLGRSFELHSYKFCSALKKHSNLCVSK
ncbi:hypothetical protein Hanom_Chr05g00415721 [Helianthus anomalus]